MPQWLTNNGLLSIALAGCICAPKKILCEFMAINSGWT